MRDNNERYNNIIKKAEERSAHKDNPKAKYWIAGGCAAAAVIVLAVAVPAAVNSSALPAQDVIVADAVTDRNENAVTDTIEIADAATAISEEDASGTGFEVFSDYNGVYEAISYITESRNVITEGDMAAGNNMDMAVAEEAAAEDTEEMLESTASEAKKEAVPIEEPVAPEAGEADIDYTETNVQVEGVDEADIIKTDGKYIYYLCEDRLYVAEAAGKNSEVLGRLKLGGSHGFEYAQEMYLIDDKLVVLGRGYNESAYSNDWMYEDMTWQVIIDISDPSSPEIVKELGQSGGYVSSRAVDGYVYTVTSRYIWNILKDDPVTYVPFYTEGDKIVTVDPGDICIAKDPDTFAYTVVSSLNVEKAEMVDSVKAVFGGAGNIYSDGNCLIATAGSYSEDTTETVKNGKECTVIKRGSNTKVAVYDIRGGKVELKQLGTVNGYLLNQFSMDVYDGYYRFVTGVDENTTYIYTEGIDTYEYDFKSSNALYILDEGLNEVGSITDISEGEQVKSVRFDGDKVYFVTFVQTDPLFCADVSDPQNPKITSELKLPGFSSYLHVMGPDRLLGFGYDADEDTGMTGFVKLSMFDSSDKNELKELATSLVSNCSYSEATYNHKSLLIDSEDMLIGFPGENEYYLYSYDDKKGFERLLRLRGGDEEYWYGSIRGLIINDFLYVVDNSGITVADLEDLKTVSRLDW